jgi:hypothetical protein
MSIRFPRGLRRIVDEYRDRVRAILPTPDDEVLWDDPHGCGSFGCVFPIMTPIEGMMARPRPPNVVTMSLQKSRYVLKFSVDPTEGPVVKAIMDTGLDKRLDGLVRWDGVWRIPGGQWRGSMRDAWVILREDVRPFNAIEDIQFGRAPRWIDWLRQFNYHSRESFTLKTERKRRQHEDEASAALGELYNREETYFLAEAIEELRRRDIILADVHHGNLGFRIHDWSDENGQSPSMVRWYDGVDRPPLLVFDPGHSRAPEGIAVEDLVEQIARANPWAEDVAEGIEEL